MDELQQEIILSHIQDCPFVIQYICSECGHEMEESGVEQEPTMTVWCSCGHSKLPIVQIEIEPEVKR